MHIKKNIGKTLQIECNGSMAEIFQEIANAEEVFADEKCSICGSNSSFRVRNVPDKKRKGSFVYFERVCLNGKCKAKLAYGQAADGSGNLFPKRKLENGGYDATHRGWSRYVPEQAR